VVALVALMPSALAGRATYIAVDLAEPTSPYRESLDRPPHVVSPIQTDQIEHLPITLRFVDELLDGDLQLWEPRIGAGTPTLAAYPWLASPFNLLYVALPDPWATTLDAALTILVGQIFMFLFVRRLGASRAAATAGAVAYALTGTAMVFIQRPFGVAWVLPGLLWAIHRAFERLTVGRMLAVAGLVAWCWFEGFPSAFAYSIYTAALWAIWLAYRRYRRLRPATTSWREAATAAVARLAAVGGGFVAGVLLAGVSLVPFLAEVERRGLLDLRPQDLNSHLPAVYIWSLFDLSVNGDPLDPSTVWAGINPFESITMVGSIVLVGAFAGLVPVLSRRFRLTADGRDAWPFFAVLAVVITFLVFVGTRLLGWLYEVPGIAGNPFSRARFLIALGLCVLATLHLDTMLGIGRARTEPLPPKVALAVLAGWLLIAAVTVDDVVRGFTGPGPTKDWVWGVAVGALFVALATAVIWLWRRHGRGLPAVAGTLLAALIFVQVAYPLRDFTPEAPVDLFYPTTSAHEVLEELSDGRYRFAATGLNFYPNSAQLLDLYDLRGIALYDRELRALLTSATPETFQLDNLKQLLTRDEWNLTSPAYDDLALGLFALATTETPYGREVDADDGWDRWAPTQDVDVDVTVPPGEELAGLAVPLRARGDCGSAALRFRLLEGGREVDEVRRPASDAAGDWVAVGLLGRDLRGERATVAVDVDGDCDLEVGVVGATDGGDRPARTMYLDDPDDGVRLVATEQAWIYERPTARQIVSAHSAWRWFPDQPTLLAALEDRSEADADTVYLVGEGDDQPSEPGGPTLHDVDIGDGEVVARVVADEPGLVVLAQDFSAGWTVAVDGRGEDLQSVDGALMGVFVPEGEHVVRFRYQPGEIRAGAAVTVLAILACAGAAVVAGLARRRRPQDQP
jgi:hypothetical protein